ncbi:NAD(P)H-hydrate epimerase [Haloplanus salinus]|uniref:NAD(P)H-hydrate epimerase n=1 Tax=Haloplanus salinus TaxID=1126245 RepID=A0A368N499_9EURY|nr:NAD(P)H-hydrate epimerase [Haloplanus salinus]RCU44371.1 NAD(P)H-hydrate epimerase [Haloplanus salinus]
MTTDAFVTASGTHVPAVTAETMRDVDRVAVEDVGLQLLQMMENAGRTLAHRVAATGEEPVVVVAGNGGNGGGGLACARHLHNHDVRVAVVLDRDPDALSGAAAQQYGILDATDVSVTSGVEELAAFDRIGVLVDALIGYGLDGPIRDPARSFVEETNRRGSSVVSLDVPSGIDATTGETLGAAVHPETTVSLALPKTGLRTGAGQLVLADIGIPRVVYDRLDIAYDDPFGREWWIELVTGD